MTESWIVGIDGSEGALAALRWAAVNGRRANAEVTAVCAFHVPLTLSVLSVKRGFDVDRLGMEAEAHHILDEALAAIEGPTDHVQTLALEGQPGATLLESAAEGTLLVLGRRGHSGLRHLVLGSVSNYCATHAEVPVVVVPTDWDSAPFESVVVGFDGSANARSALAWALEIAPDDVPIRLVMAIEPAPWLSEDVTLARFPDEVRLEEQRIEDAANEVDPNGRAVRDVLLHGPRQALAEASGAAGLVVVGARGHGRIGSALLGSVSTWLLHNAPCPIAVVPRSHEDD